MHFPETEDNTENMEPSTIEQQQLESKITNSITEKTMSEQNTKTSENEKKVDAFSKKLQVKNPFNTLTPKVTQLVYWENPTLSGAILAIGLSFLIYTAYYSLFNTFFALATILIGFNWVYVISRKQFQALINQEPINPHEHLLVNKPWYIERKEVEKHLDIAIEAVNFVLLEVQRIVLVDDPMRTIRYVFVFYILWTLGCWISVRTFFGIGLVLGFATPIAYQKNQKLVDEKLNQANKFLHSHLDRGLDIAKQHTGGIVEKAKSFAVNKGLVNDKGTTQTTKKEE